MILNFREFLKESPKQLVDVVFGDAKRLGQSRIMGAIIGKLTKDKNNPSPVFGMDTAISNLLKAGVAESDIQKIRQAVIRGMELTIKKENIPRRYIEDLPDKLFERYRFYLEDYAPHPGATDLVVNYRKQAYTSARKAIEREIKNLNIMVNKK